MTTTRVKHIPKKLLDQIVNKTAKHFLIDKDIILGRSRRYPYPKARSIVAKELRSHGFSYPLIAKAMGKDHTTIIHMVDDEFREKRINKCRERYHKNKKETK